jgi:hypothetical protein
LHPVIDIVDALSTAEKARSLDLSGKVITIMVDLLITDLRDAMQKLCQREDIRVAIFTEQQRDIGARRHENVLSMIASTEFDKNYQQSTFFRKPLADNQYQGFCGEVWATKRAQSGACRRGWLFKKDRRFFLYNPKDKRRSFLCLPVFSSERENSSLSAIISIDSGSSFDFRLGGDLLEEINISLKPIRKLANEYLEILELTK